MKLTHGIQISEREEILNVSKAKFRLQSNQTQIGRCHTQKTRYPHLYRGFSVHSMVQSTLSKHQS